MKILFVDVDLEILVEEESAALSRCKETASLFLAPETCGAKTELSALSVLHRCSHHVFPQFCLLCMKETLRNNFKLSMKDDTSFFSSREVYPEKRMAWRSQTLEIL